MQQTPSNLSIKIRQRFETGLTKSHSHREQQLQNLLKGLNLMQQEIVEGIQNDLHQGQFISYQQFASTFKEIQHILKSFKRWEKKAGTTDLIQFFSSKQTIQQPKGIVAIIVDLPTSNLLEKVLVPLSVAVSAGNCVVLKINSPMENTKKAVEKLFHEFLDPFSINLFEGSLEELTQYSLDHIHYIGNQNTSGLIQKMLLNNQAQPSFSSELSRLTPAIIDSDADIEYATQQIAANKWSNAGQNLQYSISKVYVHQSVSNKFLTYLKLNVEKQFGYDARASPEYAKLISGIESLKEKLDNTKIEFGGQFDLEQKYLAPTIILTETLGDLSGPILPVSTFEKLNKIVSKLNESNQEVDLFFFSKSKENQRFIQQNLDRLNNFYINTCYDLSHPYQIGALRGSFGKALIYIGFDLVSRQIQVTQSNFKLLTFYPPFNTRVQNQLSTIFKIPYIPQRCFLQGLAGVGALYGLYRYSKRPSKK